MNRRHYKILFLLAMLTPLLSCCTAEDGPTPTSNEGHELYIVAELATGDMTRVSYTYPGSILKNTNGDMQVRWETGDVIKVYETDAYGDDDPEPAYTTVYHDYADYNVRNPYPTTPDTDCYYRFECVEGSGTTHGVFKYIGLVRAKKTHDPVTGGVSMKVEIKYNHKIRNWDRFEGVAVYENATHSKMLMQEGNSKMTHLKYGQRLSGPMCAHNFQWWFDKKKQGTAGVGARGLVLKNVDNCLYAFAIGGLDVPIYGGSTISLQMPLATVANLPLYNEPITLTIGSETDFLAGKAAMCKADPDREHLEELNYVLLAYMNGWPGTLASGQPVVVTLRERGSGNVYQWTLTSDHDIEFKEAYYYLFDLRDDEWTKNQ